MAPSYLFFLISGHWLVRLYHCRDAVLFSRIYALYYLRELHLNRVYWIPAVIAGNLSGALHHRALHHQASYFTGDHQASYFAGDHQASYFADAVAVEVDLTSPRA